MGDPHRTILGAMVIAVPGTGMSLSGIDPIVRQVLLGAAVIVAIATSIDRRKIEVVT